MKQIIYKKILVTNDGSALANEAIPHAVAIALACKAKIVLLRIVISKDQILGYIAPDAGLMLPPTAVDDIMKALKETKKIVKQELQKLVHGIKNIEVHVEEGSTGTSIVNTAKKLKCDLIVMSTHGRTGLGRAVLGSVTDYVIKHATCPVLVVHPSQK